MSDTKAEQAALNIAKSVGINLATMFGGPLGYLGNAAISLIFGIAIGAPSEGSELEEIKSMLQSMVQDITTFIKNEDIVDKVGHVTAFLQWVYDRTEDTTSKLADILTELSSTSQFTPGTLWSDLVAITQDDSLVMSSKWIDRPDDNVFSFVMMSLPHR